MPLETRNGPERVIYVLSCDDCHAAIYGATFWAVDATARDAGWQVHFDTRLVAWCPLCRLNHAEIVYVEPVYDD